jgi:hypothetical protein
VLFVLVVYSSVILLSPVGPGIYGATFNNNGVVFSLCWSLNTDQAAVSHYIFAVEFLLVDAINMFLGNKYHAWTHAGNYSIN